MKKGYKRFYAYCYRFNNLQSLRNVMDYTWNVSGIRWCGSWNGINWERLSFYCTPETAKLIKTFCDNEELKITINN